MFVSELYLELNSYIAPQSKSNTHEQNYVIEILCAMITCKSYNLFKEIFRLLCIITLSKSVTEVVHASKTKLQSLITQDKLMTMAEELKTNYRYDKLRQHDDVIDLSQCDQPYELSKSILELPIYKGSYFYLDLDQIYLDAILDIANHECSDELNDFYTKKLIPAFTKQFGGIVPLWTGITVPKGIARHHNQPAEKQMDIAKSDLVEQQLKIGSGKVRPTRFLKLLRKRVLAKHAQYMCRLPSNYLNHVKRRTQPNRKKTEKDNSKVTKKIRNHILTSAKRQSTRIKSKSTDKAHDIDSSGGDTEEEELNTSIWNDSDETSDIDNIIPNDNNHTEQLNTITTGTKVPQSTDIVRTKRTSKKQKSSQTK